MLGHIVPRLARTYRLQRLIADDAPGEPGRGLRHKVQALFQFKELIFYPDRTDQKALIVAGGDFLLAGEQTSAILNPDM